VAAPIRRLRWAVLLLNFDPVQGHEQGGERRALVVSYEPLHSAGMIAVCPVTAARSEPARPAEVRIPVGEAGQTKPGAILCHQVRTVSLLRAKPEGPVRYLTNPDIRAQVREALAMHLGLDIPGSGDGASVDDYFGPDAIP
jgi:mRNA-degrading endonuclease toxin of MazEF toxin-antitoxin module